MRGLISRNSSREFTPRSGFKEAHEDHHIVSDEHIWSKSDRKAQKAMLDELFLDPSEMTPFKPLFQSPEVAGLLALPQEQMGEKLSVMLSSLNLVAGLMLSGVMVSGLSPSDSASYEDENQRLLNNVKNLLSTILITLNINVVLFTTYLICQLAVEPPENILRVVSRGAGLVLYQLWTFVSGFIVLAILCITNVLNSTGMWRWSSAIAIVTMVVLGMSHFFLSLGQMFPLVMVRWATSVYPLALLTQSGKELIQAARRDKINKQRGVMKNLGINCHPDLAKNMNKLNSSTECEISNLMIDGNRKKMGSNLDIRLLTELMDCLSKAILTPPPAISEEAELIEEDTGTPRVVSHHHNGHGARVKEEVRLHEIAVALLNEDVTVSVLKSLLDGEGKGTQSLIQILSELQDIKLTVGEKMKIAHCIEAHNLITITDCENGECT